jgi:hypothetical protein
MIWILIYFLLDDDDDFDEHWLKLPQPYPGPAAHSYCTKAAIIIILFGQQMHDVTTNVPATLSIVSMMIDGIIFDIAMRLVVLVLYKWIYRADAITEARLRLYPLITTMPISPHHITAYAAISCSYSQLALLSLKWFSKQLSAVPFYLEMPARPLSVFHRDLIIGASRRAPTIYFILLYF